MEQDNDNVQPGDKLGTTTLQQFSELENGATEATPSSSTKKSFSFYMSVLCLGFIVLVVSWDATSLAVAIPVIASQLHATTLQSFWASISFMLAVAVTQPIYASVSDVMGRKLPLYAAMLLFAVGSVVFAVANNMAVVIAGRVLQGLGGGGLDVLEAIILADITSLKERPLYLGLIAIPIATGSVIGPIVGALFSEFVSWRWIGWVNLPIVGIAFVLAFFFLHLRPIDLAFSAKLRRLDWVGMLLFAVGAVCLALPLSWANSLYPWSSWRTIVPLVIGVVVLGVFAFYEARPVEAVIPYRLFDNITAIMALLGAFLHGSIMYTIVLYFPLFFQVVFLQAPLQSAVSILPVCCLTVGFSVISPVAVQMTRRYRLQLWVGWVLTTVFIGLWCLLDRNSPRAEADVFQVVLGIGIGTVFTTTAIPMQASVKNVDDTGLAAGILVVFRLFGGLVGLAIGSTAFNTVFAKSIAALEPLPETLKTLEDASQAVGFIPSLRTLDLPEATMHALLEAYRIPFRTVWIVTTCLSGAGLLTSLFLRELDLEKEDLGRQRFEPSS